jgi:hypothetical protein
MNTHVIIQHAINIIFALSGFVGGATWWAHKQAAEPAREDTENIWEEW